MDSRLRGNDELLQLGLSKCHSGQSPLTVKLESHLKMADSRDRPKVVIGNDADQAHLKYR
ncbi:MAG: hypothetical protein ACJAYB_003276 [Psychromonas sp.]|jgi:hypothetical protein